MYLSVYLSKFVCMCVRESVSLCVRVRVCTYVYSRTCVGLPSHEPRPLTASSRSHRLELFKPIDFQFQVPNNSEYSQLWQDAMASGGSSSTGISVGSLSRVLMVGLLSAAVMGAAWVTGRW